MTHVYDDGQARVYHGDALAMLREMPSESVHCAVTSPPYFGLRDYGIDGQIGLEETPEDYIAKLVAIFRELRRVLRSDGTLWANCGDSYHDKQLQMIPARLAIALQQDGWILRSDVAWVKKAPMPESVTDRPTSAWEHVFLLSKSERYFYDAEAVREPNITTANVRNKADETYGQLARLTPNGSGTRDWNNPAGSNQRNAWVLGPDPSPESHFATFPREIPRRDILAGTSGHGVCASCGAPWERVVERTGADMARRYARGESARHGLAGAAANMASNVGEFSGSIVSTGWRPTCTCAAAVVPATVLDPFLGSGRTLEVAKKLGRRGVGIDLNEQYLRELAIPKVQQQGLFMGQVD